jgi:hypothetical protein
MRRLPLIVLAALAALPASAHAAVLAGGPAYIGQFGAHGAPLGAFPGTGAFAAGDVNGDGVDDVVVAGELRRGTVAVADVVVRDGRTHAVLETLAPGLPAPLRVAAAGGRVVVASAGVVKVYAGGTLTQAFAPYPGYTGAIAVAAGDVDGDGQPDVVTAPATGTAFVKAFSGADASLLRAFLAPGATIAAGDGQIVAAGASTVNVYDAVGLTHAFHASATSVAIGGGRLVLGSGGLVRVLDADTLATRAAFVPFAGAPVSGVAVQRQG